jgi:hypothetical protein
MAIKEFHAFMAAVLLSASGLASGAGNYFLKDEGARWLSEQGEPIKGVHKSSLLICKLAGPCYGLIYAGWELGAWRQRGTMWESVNLARRQIEESELDRVELDSKTGRALYISAERGYRRSLR